MEHKLKLDKALLWDYEITQGDLDNEKILIFYLSRLLNNGSYRDIAEVPLQTIEKYLKRLHLSSRVRRFWEWYLQGGTEEEG